jgi:hypothetical protein
LAHDEAHRDYVFLAPAAPGASSVQIFPVKRYLSGPYRLFRQRYAAVMLRYVTNRLQVPPDIRALAS